MKTRNIFLTIAFTMFVIFICSATTSAAQEPNDSNGLLNMSLEELMDVKVVSGSRSEQSIRKASVAMSVITAEDIHYSGLTRLDEILQFAPGVDYLRLNRAIGGALGVRGMHELTSDRTLTLIDGRPAESPFFGGAEYFRYPLLLEDIERVEIVRGPGGAAWGANAFNGVINIITKKPSATQGGLVTTTMSEFGDIYSQLRYGFTSGNLAMRTSVGYESVVDSDKAGAGDFSSVGTPTLNSLIGYSDFEAQDWRRNIVADTSAEYKISEDVKAYFGLAYSRTKFGNYENAGYFPQSKDAFMDTFRAFFKLEREFSDGSKGYLQWTGNYSDTTFQTYTSWETVQNDFEAQYSFAPSDKHELTVGTNARFAHINTFQMTDYDLQIAGEPFDEQQVGIFGIHRYHATDRLTFETQLRADYYSETQTDWSGRFTALYDLDAEGKNTLRLGAAKAFRAPFVGIRESSVNRVSLDPLLGPGSGLYGINILPVSGDLENEETWSIEGGYTSKLSDNATLAWNNYYQKYKKLIGYAILNDPSPYGRILYQLDNYDDAKAYGSEIEMQYRTKMGLISAWYAYNDFQREEDHQPIRAYMPSKHKVGVTTRWFIGDGFTFNTNYKYSDVTGITDEFGAEAEMNHRLDLTLAKEFAKGNGEVMVGVADVLNNTNGPNYIMGSATAMETPGRMFFARLQLKF